MSVQLSESAIVTPVSMGLMSVGGGIMHYDESMRGAAEAAVAK